MPDRPLLMSAPMVRACLAGTKSVMRGPIKPTPRKGESRWLTEIPANWNPKEIIGADANGHMDVLGHTGLWGHDGDPETDVVRPRLQPGDVAYVCEAWKTYPDFDDLPPRDIPADSAIAYLAEKEPEFKCGRYRHSRFMCKWMSRLWAPVLSVRPERLQEITPADVLREGIVIDRDTAAPWMSDNDLLLGEFSDRWNAIYGPGAWEANPWCWRYEVGPWVGSREEINGNV